MKLKLQRQLCPFDATRDLERQDSTEVSGNIIKGIWGLSLCCIRTAERVMDVVVGILVKANTADMKQATWTRRVKEGRYHGPCQQPATVTLMRAENLLFQALHLLQEGKMRDRQWERGKKDIFK